jgi:hypothetical protein
MFNALNSHTFEMLPDSATVPRIALPVKKIAGTSPEFWFSDALETFPGPGGFKIKPVS